MKNVYVVAHTHWDFEWYFSRQEARVQFMYHMDEVLDALEKNELAYYTLDGQMSIVDDYLATCPDKRQQVEKFVKAKRLWIGPWYTQIDEMVTSGEAIVHNLQQGIRKAEDLGNVMKVGYLPDSFGQSQDMPKIYQGFGIENALFWRGMPKELPERYFNWQSEDGSTVLVANLKNGYYVGAEWMMDNPVIQKITTNTDINDALLPVGGDQRAVDRNLKSKIQNENQKKEANYHESTYLQFFDKLASQRAQLPTYEGEFVDPTDSKIHRGIYSSRADLKQLYDSIERQMVYEVQPLMVIASRYGIESKLDACAFIWETVARGQAHDSSGGCNTDKTNEDIYQRGVNAKQMSQSIVDYLIRKLSEAVADIDIVVWNPQPQPLTTVKTIEISTATEDFILLDETGKEVDYDLLEQTTDNAAPVRRNEEERLEQIYYISKIAIPVKIAAMDYQGFNIKEGVSAQKAIQEVTDVIENNYYKLRVNNDKIDLYLKAEDKWITDIIHFEDGGDEGDTYDYSPAYEDDILDLTLNNAMVKVSQDKLQGTIKVIGNFEVPKDLTARKEKELNAQLPYELNLTLKDNDQIIYWSMQVDNRQVKDHRFRMIWNTNVNSSVSTADTPFGMIERPMNDIHLDDWQEIGYREEPTSLRPLIHFANINDKQTSWTFLLNGTKVYQMISESQIALTLYRGVGFLGRPDTLRRPGDASGLECRYVETPDSQLNKVMNFTGGLVVDKQFDPVAMQAKHYQMQEVISYQNQVINRFVNPLKFFQNLAISTQVKHDSFIEVVDNSVVISSIEMLADKTGYLVRLYNPSKDKGAKATLRFNEEVFLQLVNLNDETLEFVADNIRNYETTEFKPGEIRTYAIYPHH